eukprot:scaffold63916_cov33-Phaeocystis_antarctica.AAC.1
MYPPHRRRRASPPLPATAVPPLRRSRELILISLARLLARFDPFGAVERGGGADFGEDRAVCRRRSWQVPCRPAAGGAEGEAGDA